MHGRLSILRRSRDRIAEVREPRDTPDQALENLDDAKRLYIESTIEDGTEPTPHLAVTHTG